MLRGFLVSIGVVENKLMVLNEFGDAVNFDFGLVHLNARVETTDRVDFACECLLLEEGTLADADADIHGG